MLTLAWIFRFPQNEILAPSISGAHQDGLPRTCLRDPFDVFGIPAQQPRAVATATATATAAQADAGNDDFLSLLNAAPARPPPAARGADILDLFGSLGRSPEADTFRQRLFAGPRAADADPHGAPARAWPSGGSTLPQAVTNERVAFAGGPTPAPNAPRNPFADINPF